MSKAKQPLQQAAAMPKPAEVDWRTLPPDALVTVRLAEDSPLPHFHDPATHLTVTREPQRVARRRVGAACECRPDVLIEAAGERTATTAAAGQGQAQPVRAPLVGAPEQPGADDVTETEES